MAGENSGCSTVPTILSDKTISEQAASVAALLSPGLEIPKIGVPNLLRIGPATLNPVRPVPFEPIDAGLDPEQREAVALALATPDVFLVQGGGGCQQTRLAAEIIRQFALQGLRTLLLAPSSAGIDAVLDHLTDDPKLWIFRTLGAGESVDGLPFRLRRWTIVGWQDHYQQSIRQAQCYQIARAADLHQAELRLEAYQERLKLIETIHQLSPSPSETDSAASISKNVHQEAQEAARGDQPFQRHLILLEQESTNKILSVHLALDSRREQVEAAKENLTTLRQQFESLRSQAKVRPVTRWWFPFLRQPGVQPDLTSRLADLQQQITATENHLATLLEIHRLEEEIESQLKFQSECRLQILQEEIDRRVAILASRDKERQQQREMHQQRLINLDTLLADGAPLTPGENLAGCDFQEQLNRECHLARKLWEESQESLESLQGIQEQLNQTLCRNTNLLAMSLAELPGDPHFQAAETPGIQRRPFDRIVVQDAEQLTEADFEHLSLRTGRCILLGRKSGSIESPVGSSRASGNRGGIRAVPLRPQYFTQLWQHLHGDPRRYPCAWYHRDGKLICKLQPVSSDLERWIQVESVADRPDIQLQILAAPRSAPQLVAMIFPPLLTIHQAKEYLYQELQQLTIQFHSPYYHWRESSERIQFLLTEEIGEDLVPVPLENGVREQLLHPIGEEAEPIDGPSPWRTCGLEFDRRQGWDRFRAENWIASRLGFRYLGRTVCLPENRHARPELRACLHHLLGEEGPQPAKKLSGFDPPIHLVAVPATLADSRISQSTFTDTRSPGPTSAVAVRTRKRGPTHGAGLELDLQESHRVDLIPAELRSRLPASGLVNYLEALAVIQALETILDSASVASSEEWMQTHRPADPYLAILALTSAQVDLLTALFQRHRHYTDWRGKVFLGLPGDLKYNICHTALVSLVRSHTHHAVTYGQDPDDLHLALSLASQRLILFADTGTLVRRSQWSGPLDHLDELAARQERFLINRLVQELRRDPIASRWIQVHEGCYS